MNFILDVSKWVCGSPSDTPDCSSGKGESYLLNRQGYMCCVGQLTRQFGIHDRDLLGTEYPSELGKTYLRELYPKHRDLLTTARLDGDWECVIEDTNLVSEMAKINDQKGLSLASRVNQLDQLLYVHGVNLYAINYRGHGDIEDSGVVPEMFDCPECGNQSVRAKTMSEGGGVECVLPKCEYSFCY